MSIRTAVPEDSTAICNLLEQLDYSISDESLKGKINILLTNPQEKLLVYESNGKVMAVLSLQFLTQIGLKGDIARIAYFAVDNKARSAGIGAEMEHYITELALKRNCDRIEVHCHERRKDAHRFYARQGYIESPKYLIKPLP